MYSNLLALHAVDPTHQVTISVDDIFKVTETFESSVFVKSKHQPKEKAAATNQLEDLEWPPKEDEFVITLEEDQWNLGSVCTWNETNDSVKIQLLEPIKTLAKDDVGKTYWIYPSDENMNSYEEKNILGIRPSVSLAKNIK